MPSTVAGVMAAAGLSPDGVARWTEPLPGEPGVYMVTLGNATRSRQAAVDECPVSLRAIRRWIEAREGDMMLDGKRATAEAVAERMQELWLPDEVILYIGKADGSLRGRVGAYYTTQLGKRRPHAGGRFLKTLALLDELWVHYGCCDDAEEADAQMLGAFIESVSETGLARLRDPDHPFPFAILEWKPRDPSTGRRRRFVKDHGLTNDVEPRAKL
jgi:hypothetical protein